MKALLLALALIAAMIPAVAQQPNTAPRIPPPSSADPAPAAAAQLAQPPITIPAEYHITLSPQEVDALGLVINELPARIANPLAQKVQSQINAQVQEATKKAADAKAAEPKK